MIIVVSLQSKCGEPVLVAGDPERAHIQKVKEEGGIHYHTNLLQALVNTPNCDLHVCVMDRQTCFISTENFS